MLSFSADTWTDDGQLRVLPTVSGVPESLFGRHARMSGDVHGAADAHAAGGVQCIYEARPGR
jgi:hypothetical protein